MMHPSSQSRRNFLKGVALAGGAATLSNCATTASDSAYAPVITHKHTPTFFPKHNERTKGWLKYLWEKSTFQDDWGYREDQEPPWGINLPRGEIDWTYDGKGPHPMWDQYTSAPLLSYPRFDLADSSYAVMLMCDQTPAWREVYTRIMHELATRHTSYWAAIDWNTFIGPSPDRKNYPPAAMQLWPERVRGNYDAPGWTANGIEPWGLQPDPIGADGNLFFRGWLNLVLSIYKYVSGDDKWERPWEIAGYENAKFEWTQPKIVEHLHQQYIDHPEGPQCENTKIWPFCNAAAGLGIYLSDQLGVTNAHGAFENWIEFMRDNYMGFNNQNEIEWMTMFYDPIADFKVNIPGTSGTGGGTAFYLLPQSTEIATQIYDATANAQGWRDPRRQIQPNNLGLVMAKALGDYTVAARLSAAAERDSEPRWFGEEVDKFGWWFNYNEPYPRGQGSGQLMITEIAGSSWIDAFKVRHMDKYRAPTLEGVDFPSMGIDTAWNDKASGVLHIGTYAADRSRTGQATSWRITNLPDANEAVVICDGSTVTNIEILDNNSIRVPGDIGQHQYQIYTGYFGQDVAISKPKAPLTDSVKVASARRSAEQNVKAAEAVIASGAVSCPCCSGVA